MNRPSRAQKSLLEDCVQIIDGMLESVVPGATARAIGRKGEDLSRKVGYFDFPPPNTFPLFGHHLGATIPPMIIPFGDVAGGELGWKSLEDPLQPGMVLGIEAFLAARAWVLRRLRIILLSLTRAQSYWRKLQCCSGSPLLHRCRFPRC